MEHQARKERGVGRHKLRWGDSVDQDIRLLGERNWKNLALKGKNGGSF
jgi:hypothetical protein